MHACIRSGVLSDLAHRYAGILANPEFDGILDSAHPECTGERFATLEGDRVLRIECDDPQGARYALDDARELHEYLGPVRVGEAESVVAFCGEEYTLEARTAHALSYLHAFRALMDPCTVCGTGTIYSHTHATVRTSSRGPPPVPPAPTAPACHPSSSS